MVILQNNTSELIFTKSEDVQLVVITGTTEGSFSKSFPETNHADSPEIAN